MNDIHQEGFTFQGPTRFYTIAGDLRLTEQSGRQEFDDALSKLRARIRSLEGISAAELAGLDTELAEVAEAAEAEEGEPGEPASGDVVAGRLTRFANRLRLLGGATTAAVELGNSVDQLAQWAGAHF